MAENNDLNSLGKKIFFLHPSAFVKNQIVEGLAQDEFEVYVVKDEAALRRLLKKYPDSVVFANINEVLRENVWEEWIKVVLNNPETASVDIGVIAPLSHENLRSKYIGQYNLRGGFTVLKSDGAVAIKQLSDILNKINAKGRRKYIRVLMGENSNATVNFPLNGTFVNGIIKDISVVGFSCTFADDPVLVKNSLFTDIQIRLQPQLLKAEGIIYGSREEENEKIYVVLFTQRTSPDVKSKIRKYIAASLQTKMDKELK